MKRRHFLMTAASTALVPAMPVHAQAYPARPIRMVIPFPPGGPTDSFARLYAGALGKQLGQSVVVDNKAGASGAIGALEVKNSAADGYTLLFGTASTHALYNLTEKNPRYDALKDFKYVAVLGGAPVAFAVSPSMPRSLKSLVIAAKQSPGTYNYGSPGTGTFLHVAAERLKQQTGAPIVHVPYKGSGPALQDMLGGNIEMMVGTLGGLIEFHRSGRAQILGVASAKRLDTAPDIPTVSESADLDKPFEAMLWNVVTAPRDTPDAVLQKLADASKRAMTDPVVTRTLADQAMFADLHVGNAAALAFVQAEQAKWKPIIANLGDLTAS